MSSCSKTLLSRSYPLVKPLKNPYESLLNNPIHKSLFIFFSTHLPTPVSYPIKPKIGELKEENVGFLNEIKEEEKKGKDGVVSKTEFSRPFDSLTRSLKLMMSDQQNMRLEEILLSLKAPLPLREAALSLEKKQVYHYNRDTKTHSISLVSREISQDVQLLLRHLYDCGYFKDVNNFLPEDRIYLSRFCDEHARTHVKSAFKRFHYDNKEISKCLSGSDDAKSIALFGCPDTAKANVVAAKSLRSFFKIREVSVCGKCVLNDTCCDRYKIERENDISTLKLHFLLRLLKEYSKEEVSLKLNLTDDMKACVSRLIHEVIKLSKGINGRAIRQLQPLFPKKNN